ncbi:MAG: SCO family protein [Pseudomonadota bacterium]
MRNPLALFIAAIAFAVGLYFGLQRAPAPLSLQNATVLEPARAIAPFSLQSTRATTFDNAALSGRWTLVFFGFTRCPDICPTTLQLLSDARQALRDDFPDKALPDILLVSVDPARDTIDALQSYTAYFGDGVYGARAAEPELARFTRDLGIVYQKVPLADDDYTMDHSAAILLVGPEARLRAVFTPPIRRDDFVADLNTILEDLT